jgi:hypothetical protein
VVAAGMEAAGLGWGGGGNGDDGAAEPDFEWR